MPKKLLQCNQCGGRMRIDPGGVTVIGGGPAPIIKLRCDRCNITRFERRSDLERELAETGGGPIPSVMPVGSDFAALFDRSRFGLNLLVGVAYLLAQQLTQYTWIIPALARGHQIGWNPLRYHLALVGFDVLNAAVFVWVIHAVRRARWLPPIWGMVNLCFGLAFRGMLRLWPLAGGTTLPLFDPQALGVGFFYGFVLMLGLVTAIRLAGFKPWSLMLGAAGGHLLGAVLVQIHWVATHDNGSFNWDAPAVAVINGIILGGCLYGGLVLHYRQRRGRPAAAVRPSPAPAKTGFTAADNHGTLHDRLEFATSYWVARLTSSKKEPYVMYLFDRAEDARAALLELPCIHVAGDTGKLICTEVLIYGYYPNEQGKFEAIVGGGDLTFERWEQAKASFEKHGGKRKNDLAPERRAAPPPAAAPADPGRVKFVREDRQQKMGATFVYRVHTAPDAASAKAFLEKNPVSAKLFYLIVETPEGNYCRDVSGIYKE